MDQPHSFRRMADHVPPTVLFRTIAIVVTAVALTTDSVASVSAGVMIPGHDALRRAATPENGDESASSKDPQPVLDEAASDFERGQPDEALRLLESIARALKVLPIEC